VCLIEDNKWAVSVPKEKSTAVADNSVRASSYAIAGESVLGNDPDRVFEVVGRAVSRARAGDGPSLVEVETVRLVGHFSGDTEGYRTRSEKESRRDPIPAYRTKLIAEGVLSDASDAGIRRRAQAAVDHAFAFARASAEPPGESALECVFV
jgi:pyruvate dehydrogenase E1 component alpha subunit